MIVKKREIPLIILKLQALLERIRPGHIKVPEIKNDLSKRLAGYKGEKAVDYQLSFLPEDNFYILNDIRLNESDRFFQMDSLLLNKYYMIKLEIKNIAGTIYFDSNFHQLIRELDGKETAFQDPIVQSLQHEKQLKRWLKKNMFSNIPIHSLVVISNSNTLIRTSPHDNKILSNMVVNANYLPTKLQQIHNKYKKEIISEKEIKKIIRQLKKGHQELDQPILKKFNIRKGDILNGVICPSCSFLSMERLYGTWLCPKCQHKDKNAHLKAIKDYKLLYGSEITNQHMRDFLCINSSALATRLLKSLDVSSTGSARDRIYNLDIKNK
ncbi:nuclease-related domain-containing protein [Metabacillus litoralis]|uniref:nuclease-related domain-containing protein n=1 Tax=Metabacillus litoralis TaxID=152268 RepID=UPI0020415649|nr:nuclease-related domain-containing protein [Metabacillus litoralis]MCM3411650.1 NERD domain-containing protein [Metabacillus litoralis]